jgi:hypothetical protein
MYSYLLEGNRVDAKSFPDSVTLIRGCAVIALQGMLVHSLFGGNLHFIQ